MLLNALKHIKTISTHKWYVFKFMYKCGRPLQGFLHDISKFSYTEFHESIKYYTGKRSPIDGAKDDQGYSLSLFHHMGRNKHHSIYWVDISFGQVVPCKMPYKYLVELICDTLAAGKTYLKDNWNVGSPLEYYLNKDYKSFLHDETRALIYSIYLNILNYGLDDTFNKLKNGHYKSLYEK